MHADSVFIIGKDHKVCEDYAVHSVDQVGNPVALISDGCSGSRRTDTGARLLIHYALAQFRLGRGISYLPSWIGELVESCVQLGIHPHALHATLGMTYVLGDKKLVAQLCGDGYILARNRNGKGWVVIKTEYASGAPLYPVYLASQDTLKEYIDEFGLHKSVSARTLSPVIDYHVLSIDVQSPTAREDATDRELGMFVDVSAECTTAVFERDEYDVVLVASDGWGSWQKRELGHPSEDIKDTMGLIQLGAIKRTHGTFLQRRVWRVHDQLLNDGFVHHDDISVAGIHVEKLSEGSTEEVEAEEEAEGASTEDHTG